MRRNFLASIIISIPIGIAIPLVIYYQNYYKEEKRKKKRRIITIHSIEDKKYIDIWVEKDEI